MSGAIVWFLPSKPSDPDSPAASRFCCMTRAPRRALRTTEPVGRWSERPSRRLDLAFGGFRGGASR